MTVWMSDGEFAELSLKNNGLSLMVKEYKSLRESEMDLQFENAELKTRLEECRHDRLHGGDRGIEG